MGDSRRCKDCVVMNPQPGIRPAPHPGPRCATHHRAFKKAQKARNHDRYIVRTYDRQPGDYEKDLAAQGGKCFICQVATGKTKALAQDHCHRCGKPRIIACGPCNQMIGRLGPDALRRAAQVLEDHMKECP